MKKIVIFFILTVNIFIYADTNIVLVHGLNSGSSAWKEMAKSISLELFKQSKYVELGMDIQINSSDLCWDADGINEQVLCNGDKLKGSWWNIIFPKDVLENIQGQKHFRNILSNQSSKYIFGLDKINFKMDYIYWKYNNENFDESNKYQARVSLFSKQQEFLKNRVFSINLTNNNQLTFDAQGLELKAFIEEIARVTNVKNFILIGHSMGGLAIRAYIQNEKPTFNIEKIITLDTPHLGTTYGGIYTFQTKNAGVNLDKDSLAFKIINNKDKTENAYLNTKIFFLGYSDDREYLPSGKYYYHTNGDGNVNIASQLGSGLKIANIYKIIFSPHADNPTKADRYYVSGYGSGKANEVLLIDNYLENLLLDNAHTNVIKTKKYIDTVLNIIQNSNNQTVEIKKILTDIINQIHPYHINSVYEISSTTGYTTHTRLTNFSSNDLKVEVVVMDKNATKQIIDMGTLSANSFSEYSATDLLTKTGNAIPKDTPFSAIILFKDTNGNHITKPSVSVELTQNSPTGNRDQTSNIIEESKLITGEGSIKISAIDSTSFFKAYNRGSETINAIIKTPKSQTEISVKFKAGGEIDIDGTSYTHIEYSSLYKLFGLDSNEIKKLPLIFEFTQNVEQIKIIATQRGGSGEAPIIPKSVTAPLSDTTTGDKLVVFNPYENSAVGWSSKTTVTNFTDKAIEVMMTVFNKEGLNIEVKVTDIEANGYVDFSATDIATALLASSESSAKTIYDSVVASEPFYTKTSFKYRDGSGYIDSKNDILMTALQESPYGNRNIRLSEYDKNDIAPTTPSGEFQIGALASGDKTKANSFIKIVNMGENANQEIEITIMIPYMGYDGKISYFEKSATLKGGVIRLNGKDYTHLEFSDLTTLVSSYTPFTKDMPIKVKVSNNFKDIKMFAADRDDGTGRPRIHFINAVVD